ncbi:MAG TPA: EthD family reductase [Bacteroidales bacterium]|jgi:uncharacterized protein (TIGR02118 family)|nr:EthD family reductase [Bacteroidales bacterium]
MKKGMIKVTVMYPFSEEKSFNMDYYCNKHMNLVKESMGDFMKAVSVEKGLAGMVPNSPAPYFAMGNMYFDSLEKFQTAFSKAGNLMADIPNFTDIEPQIQISEVLLEE